MAIEEMFSVEFERDSEVTEYKMFEILSAVDNYYANVKATRIEHVFSLETDKVLGGRRHPAFVKL